MRNNVKHFKPLFVASLAGLLVAALYVVFEFCVSHSIELVWFDWLGTEHNRLLTFVAVIALGMAFFCAKHLTDVHAKWLDKHRHYKLLAIIGVGFLSLFSGATLGPEAVLIPASVLISQLFAHRHFKREIADLFGAAGIVALFVAFFNTPWAGLVGFLMARADLPKKPQPIVYLGLACSALASYALLVLVHNESAFHLPSGPSFTVTGMMLYLITVIIGVGYHKIIQLTSAKVAFLEKRLPKKWYIHALVATTGLGVLYLLGGYLMQFSGTETLADLFEKSAKLGIWFLLWMSLIKTVAVAWCLRTGYRGGAIFPLMFVGASLAAIALLLTDQFSPLFLAIAFLVGVILADRKTHLVSGPEH